VYIHGLFLDGAAWSKSEGVLMESEPKKLFVPLPVLFASANTKTEQAKVRQLDFSVFDIESGDRSEA
jgi:dynein heavy chain